MRGTNHYGHCPFCGAEVVSRTRGGDKAEDTCAAGHVYLSAYTLSRLMSEYMQMVRDTLVVCEDEFDMIATGQAKLGELPESAKGLAAKCKRMLDAIPCKNEKGQVL